MTSDDDIFAFVLMPFSSDFDDIYQLGVKAAANELGIIAERVDEQFYREGMLERIYRQIEVADLVIADMSGQNANVFYEVGYAHAKEKLCILVAQVSSDIPFDLKHQRHVIYGDSIGTLKTSLREELEWAKGEIENVRKSQIKVSLKVLNYDLTRTKYMATGTIDFAVDLNLDSNIPSPEIEVGYYYSGEGWKLYQDGKECPSTKSDVEPYTLHHFLSVPVKRLRKSAGWAHVRFTAKKTLGTAFRGETLQDSYHVSGSSLFRISTAEGNFNYELPIDVEVGEIPF